MASTAVAGGEGRRQEPSGPELAEKVIALLQCDRLYTKIWTKDGKTGAIKCRQAARSAVRWLVKGLCGTAQVSADEVKKRVKSKKQLDQAATARALGEPLFDELRQLLETRGWTGQGVSEQCDSILEDLRGATLSISSAVGEELLPSPPPPEELPLVLTQGPGSWHLAAGEEA